MEDESLEYRSVKVNMSNIIEKLKVTPDATSRLATIFQENSWSGITSSPTAEELVRVTLSRIKFDEVGTEFDTFIGMLKKIEGLDQVVAMLEKNRKE